MKITTLPAHEVHQCCCQGAIWLVDVRTPGEFRSIRAEGATNIPLNSLNQESLTPPENYQGPLYLICHSGTRAKMAAQQLSQRFEKIVLVEGGTQAWAAAGLPVIREAGSGLSLERQVRIVIGALVVLGVILSQVWNPQAIYLSAFMGLGLIFAGVTDTCPLALTLALLPWNRRAS